jgi:MFS family permease
MFARSCFLVLVWFSGFLAYAVDGLTTTYMPVFLNNFVGFFGTSFMILFGSYYVQGTLGRIIWNFRPMLKLDDLHFQKFSEKLKRYSYSFLPCLLISICWGSLTSGPSLFQQVFVEGFKLHLVWNLAANFFYWFLGATAIWMLGSIWMTIFLISRQPLNVKLSPETTTRFRELSMFGLYFSLFYFIGVSIGNLAFLINVPALSLLEIIISPYLLLIAIGIAGVLFPFYNIHITLQKMKKQELSKISEESRELLQQLDDILAKQPAKQTSNQTLTILACLFSLQVKEKQAAAAQEWPVDTSFLSKLLALGLIPIISRVIAMMIFS